MTSEYQNKIDTQKSFVDDFYKNKENIGTLETDGSLYLSVEDAQLITEHHAFISSKLLQERLGNVEENRLNERGMSRLRRNVYALAHTINTIVNQKLDSNMARNPNYTPTLAEHLALIDHVSSKLFASSFKE